LLLLETHYAFRYTDLFEIPIIEKPLACGKTVTFSKIGTLSKNRYVVEKHVFAMRLARVAGYKTPQLLRSREAGVQYALSIVSHRSFASVSKIIQTVEISLDWLHGLAFRLFGFHAVNDLDRSSYVEYSQPPRAASGIYGTYSCGDSGPGWLVLSDKHRYAARPLEMMDLR